MAPLRLLAAALLASASCAPPRDPVPEPGARQEGAPPVVVIPAALPAPPAEPAPEPPPLAVAAPAAPASPSPWRALFRDTRRVRLQPRSRALLVTELQGLETLLASMGPTDVNRPKVVRRLADSYVELEAAAERAAPEDAARASKIRLASQAAAAKYYEYLVRQYPKLCTVGGPASGQGSGCADEALYYGGYELERSGDLERARKRRGSAARPPDPP